jgi:REP element-mobilizing transposase RayT
VDRRHNLVGSRLLEPDAQRVSAERREMLQEPYVLSLEGRIVVLATIRRLCAQRGWNLLAAHVRSNHVHTIVEAETRPERIRNEFKSYASRELNRLEATDPIANAARDTEARGGYGETRMSGAPSGT